MVFWFLIIITIKVTRMYTFIQMVIMLNMISIYQYFYYLYLFTLSTTIKVQPKSIFYHLMLFNGYLILNVFQLIQTKANSTNIKLCLVKGANPHSSKIHTPKYRIERYIAKPHMVIQHITGSLDYWFGPHAMGNKLSAEGHTGST